MTSPGYQATSYQLADVNGHIGKFEVLHSSQRWSCPKNEVLTHPLRVMGSGGNRSVLCMKTTITYFLILDKGLLGMKARGFITPSRKWLQSVRLLVKNIGPCVGTAVRCVLLSLCWSVAMAERAEAWPTASCCTVEAVLSSLESADWTCHYAAIILCDWKAHRTLCSKANSTRLIIMTR